MFREVGRSSDAMRARKDGDDTVVQFDNRMREKTLRRVAAILRSQGNGVRINGRNGRLTLRVWKAA